MGRFASGLVSGIAAGIAIGVGYALTDDKYRRRMMRESKRNMRRAGHFFDDMKNMF